MFVPGADKPLASLAHTAVADQNRRGIACTKNRNVEDFLNIHIPLLPFSTSEMRAPSPGFALSSDSHGKRAAIVTAQNSSKARASVLPKRRALVFPASQTAMEANPHEISIINFTRRLIHARQPVSSLCPLRQVSSVSSRNREIQVQPDLADA
jgi:hypothetical protein